VIRCVLCRPSRLNLRHGPSGCRDIQQHIECLDGFECVQAASAVHRNGVTFSAPFAGQIAPAAIKAVAELRGCHRLTAEGYLPT
jgi:hypothetical protein